MVVWSVFSGAIALTYNFVSLFIIRVIFGMGKVRCQRQRASRSTIGFRKRKGKSARHDNVRNAARRSRFRSDRRIDRDPLGWKASFVLIMIIGLVWTCFWMKFMKDKPADSGSLSPEKEARPKKDTGIPLSFI